MPRILLALSAALGLAFVGMAAQRHRTELRRSFEESEARAVAVRLRERGGEVADRLRGRLAAADVIATYGPDGALLRPAPPATARPFVPPARTPAAFYLARGEAAKALAVAESSADRAAALLRLGDAASLRKALAEEALQGTDLACRARLELFRLEGVPVDGDWRDDVSALVHGGSPALGRALLREAGLTVVGSAFERGRLAVLGGRAGVFLDGDRLCLREEGRLRMLPVAGLDLGKGPIAVPLPTPFEALELRGAVDREDMRRRLGRQVLMQDALYGLAGLLILGGAGYAWLAIRRERRLARAKDDFLANVTHELKTPLSNLRLYAESLREGRVREEDTAEFVGTILGEAARLETLVEGLLHAARGPRLTMRTLDPASLVRQAAARGRARRERDGFTLAVEAPALPSVQGDEEALLRALDNLFDNACKYAREDRRLALSGEVGDGTVRLTLRDHGPGIPVSARARVLQPFDRLESADRKETPGAGLGLSLVVATMEAHGGRVAIGAPPDGGTAVTLILPVRTP